MPRYFGQWNVLYSKESVFETYNYALEKEVNDKLDAITAATQRAIKCWKL